MYCGEIGVSSLTIQCTIEGVGVDVIVETGASNMIISPVPLNSSANGWDQIQRLQNYSLQLAPRPRATIIGHGFVTLMLGQFKQRIEVWVAEMCDLCPI